MKPSNWSGMGVSFETRSSSIPISSMETNFVALSGDSLDEAGELCEGDKALIFAGVFALWNNALAAAKA
jgi:hypothetical protein